jgi:hypothetical protein
MRETEGFQGGSMSILRFNGQGNNPMANDQTKDDIRIESGGYPTTENLREFGSIPVGQKEGWSLLHLLPGQSREEEVHLSLSIHMDQSQRGDTARVYNPSYRPEQVKRSYNQSPINDTGRSQSVTPAIETIKPEIIIGDNLPVGTVLYDIWVDDDHSYIAEGLVSKNTNCRCRWEIEKVMKGDRFEGWNCTWVVIRDKESCDDCIGYGEEYNPLFIPNPEPEEETTEEGGVGNAGG